MNDVAGESSCGRAGDDADREEDALMLLRRLLGDALRRQRLHQERTLRDVSADARVSLGYLSEVERGQKEASSELLASICEALGVNLSQVLREVSDEMAACEVGEPVGAGVALVPVSRPAKHTGEIGEIAGESLATNVVGMSAGADHQVVAAA
jgi:XRE family transcriptional regulator, stress-response regulator